MSRMQNATPTPCEICTQITEKPVSANFKSWGGKEVRWLICDACTLTLTNFMKRMAAKADKCPCGCNYPDHMGNKSK